MPAGTVVLSWYDRRSDPADRAYDVFVGAIDASAQTMTGGPAFCASCGVNPPFNTTPMPEPGFRTVGEYLGLGLLGLSYGVAWTETRPSATNSDIAFAPGAIPILEIE